jgi:hypothetical protein
MIFFKNKETTGKNSPNRPKSGHKGCGHIPAVSPTPNNSIRNSTSHSNKVMGSDYLVNLA